MPLPDPRRLLELGEPVAEWAKEAVKSAVDRAAAVGRATEQRVLSTARSIEIPVTRLDGLAAVPIEQRDRLAQQITRGQASLAAVSCGAAGTVPVAGLFLELAALAELNLVQVDHVARAYGFDIGGPPEGLSQHLPLGGGRTLLLVPILTTLQVKALDREGKMDSLAGLVGGTASRAEWQAISARLATAAAVGLLKMTASKPLRRVVPMAGSAISAWSSYRFTEAVGIEACRYFRDLATGENVVRGRLV